MAIFTVSTPYFYELKAAYNPILISVLTGGVNPIVYVDVYMNGVYYKTVTATSPDGKVGFFDAWNIDIRDATQEYLSAKLPYHSSIDPQLPQNIVSGLVIQGVKVRGSSVTGGFVVPDGPAPVQATMDNAAVAGVGITNPTGAVWVVMNAAIQRDEYPDLDTLLANNNVGYLQAGYKFYNLFRNPQLQVTKDTYMRLPVFIAHDGLVGPLGGPTVPSASYYLVIEDDAGNFYYYKTTTLPATFATFFTYSEVYSYYLPAGPANFAGLPVVVGSPPNWQNIKQYRIGLTSSTLPTFLSFRWKSPWIKVRPTCVDTKRFQFVNWFGHYDTIVFDEHVEEYQVKSGGWQQYNNLYFDWIGKQAFSKQRFNVRSNELITATGYFSEAEMPHVKQFLSNPICLIEKKGDSIGAGTPDYVMPVRLVDVTAQTRKIDERWFYEITVQAEPSVERINLRN